MNVLKLIQERIDQCNAHREEIEGLSDDESDALDSVYMGDIVKVADFLVGKEAALTTGCTVSKNHLNYSTDEVDFHLDINELEMAVTAKNTEFDQDALISDILSEIEVTRAFRSYMGCATMDTVDMMAFYTHKLALIKSIATHAKVYVDRFQAELSSTEPEPA